MAVFYALRQSKAPRITGLAGLLATASLLGACAQTGLGGAQSLLASNDKPPPQTQTDELSRAVAHWGQAYAKNPNDKDAALAYALNLKAAGQQKRALAVLQHASSIHRHDRDLAAEHGRLALATGQIKLAEQRLAIADDPTRPDWRIVSARATALAQQGMYKTAIPMFERALKLAPSNSTVLSNLAMAHAGAGDLHRAEGLLRTALQMPDANPRVRKNLVAVLGLMGRAEEGKAVAAFNGDAALPIRSTTGAPTAVSKHDRNGRAIASAAQR